jgi:4-diphosphocytidyl-2-C-methyl-D-erythritol kinase
VPGWPLLLLKPPFGVPTPWAYQAWAALAKAETGKRKPESQAWATDAKPESGNRKAENETLSEVSYEMTRRQSLGGVDIFNDLEAPVFRKFVLLPVMKDWLLEQPGVKVAAMSGSGSTMFAILESDAVAEALSQKARNKFGETLWCQSCQVGR